ncbi:MAG: gamma-glutamylcyclotransferase family protein [Candidatus Competibacterales bacterium]|nr:gamma-glutamylcyclotransferase family protein [Candidatus Competibacterales bacterium]
MPTDTQIIHYFAYGSNLLPQRLRERVPSSRPLDTATLTGHVLRFHKCGGDGSAKCNVLHTGRAEDRVFGVVYAMLAVEQPLLDRAEGLGAGYRRAGLTVRTATRSYRTFCYIAEPDYIDEALRPYSWYRRLVLDGARHHGLPADYVAALARVRARRDPNPERHARHWRLLEPA